MDTGALNSSFNDLRNDLQAVARDAEALLKATADVSGESISEIRTRTQDTLRRAYDHLYERNVQMRELARETDSYMRDHLWSSIAIAAGAGLMIGLLVTRATDRGPTLSD
jgi:ElaB/YqjD/DUF883 family membrane-anchored ribosome-binding protein